GRRGGARRLPPIVRLLTALAGVLGIPRTAPPAEHPRENAHRLLKSRTAAPTTTTSNYCIRPGRPGAMCSRALRHRARRGGPAAGGDRPAGGGGRGRAGGEGRGEGGGAW